MMVFVIQNTQNRDGAAIQEKLNEFIRTSEAQNKFVGILNDSLLKKSAEYREHCVDLAKTRGRSRSKMKALIFRSRWR